MATRPILLNYPDLGEKAYGILRDQIVTAELPPGRALVVVELARQLGVSRSPVTDALHRLCAEGLVEEVPRKGYFVAGVDVQDYVDLLEARLILELGAVERGIILVEPSQIDAMRRLASELAQCLDSQGRYADYARWVDLDSAFHELVVSTARNRHLVRMYRLFASHLHKARIVYSSRLEHFPGRVSLQDHVDIVAGFDGRDLPALKTAITRHIQRSQMRLKEVHG